MSTWPTVATDDARLADLLANFADPLDVEYIDGNRWRIMAPFAWQLPTGEWVTSEVGDTTDFASIPRPARLLWPSPGGPYDKPAVIHDKLYTDPVVLSVAGVARTLTRGECDRVFYEAMGATHTHWWTRRLFYASVRVGGWRPWASYRAVK